MKNKIIILLILISSGLQIYTTLNTHYFSDELSTPFTWLGIDLDDTPKDLNLGLFNRPENFNCSPLHHIKTSMRIHEQHHILPIYSSTLCFLAKLTNTSDPLLLGRYFNVFVFLILLYLLFLSPWNLDNKIMGLILINTPVVNVSFIFTRSYSLWLFLIIFSYLAFMKSKNNRLCLGINVFNMFVYPFTLLHIISQQMMFKIKKIELKYIFASLGLVILCSLLTKYLIANMDHLVHMTQNAERSYFVIATQRMAIFVANTFFDIRYFGATFYYINWNMIILFYGLLLGIAYKLRGNKTYLISFIMFIITFYFVPQKVFGYTRYFAFIYIPFLFYFIPKIKTKSILYLLLLITFSNRVYVSTIDRQFNMYLYWHHTGAVIDYIEQNPNEKFVLYAKSQGDFMRSSDGNSNLVGIYLAYSDRVEFKFNETLENLQVDSTKKTLIYHKNFQSDQCDKSVIKQYNVCELIN